MLKRLCFKKDVWTSFDYFTDALLDSNIIFKNDKCHGKSKLFLNEVLIKKIKIDFDIVHSHSLKYIDWL